MHVDLLKDCEHSAIQQTKKFAFTEANSNQHLSLPGIVG